MTTNLLIVVLSIAALWLGAVVLVDSAVRIARRIGLSELIIGLTIVAIGTSAPEFAVTVGAALRGQAEISVGNVVGSNIFNLGFILGSVALIANGIPTTRRLVRRDGSMLIGVTVVLLLMLYDLRLAAWEGILLLVGLVGYIGYLLYEARRESAETVEEELSDGEFRWFHILTLLGGLATVIAGGHFLVEAASELARAFGLSEWAIGVTIVAAGTSAPELATSLTAALRGRHGLSIGNLIGSDIFNLLGVLGVAAAIAPMTIDLTARNSVFLLTVFVVLVIVLINSRNRLSRWEGGVLIAISVGRWIADLT